MALEFQDYERPEDKLVRKKEPTERGWLYQRRYHVPIEAASLIPSKGTAVNLTDETAQANEVLRPRVMMAPQTRQVDDATLEVIVTYQQYQAFGS